MCGIFAYINTSYFKSLSIKKLTNYFNKIQHRGPECSILTKVNDSLTESDVVFGFHRLAIVDTKPESSSPFYLDDLILICNGEIYNHKELKKNYNLQTKTDCDCEVILHLVKLIGFEQTIKQLDGVFAIILLDRSTNNLYIARDPFGVRPLYFGYQLINNELDYVALASEEKALVGLCNTIEQFKPGCYFIMENCKYNSKDHYIHYFSKNIPVFPTKYGYDYYYGIKSLLIEAVNKRLMSDRPLACLLSGGLDSSLICSIVSRISNSQLHTFSIGLEGSTDLVYAEKVANYLNITHKTIKLTTDDFLNAIEKVIYCIGSWDTTTIRASVGNYLIGKYLKKHTNFKVILNGDGSDELFGGYLYMKNAPNYECFINEIYNLLDNIHYYDVKRSEACISAHGLESRSPFLDKNLVGYTLNLPDNFFYRPDKMEKYILRKAFKNGNWLPDDILNRKKEAFSDGVSSQTKSWYQIIQEHLGGGIEKEKEYYKTIFNKHFNGHKDIIPGYWMPNWSGTSDPSARTLTNY